MPEDFYIYPYKYLINMKKKRKISDFRGFAQEMTDKWGDETPSEVIIPSYRDEGEEREQAMKELEEEAQMTESAKGSLREYVFTHQISGIEFSVSVDRDYKIVKIENPRKVSFRYNVGDRLNDNSAQTFADNNSYTLSVNGTKKASRKTRVAGIDTRLIPPGDPLRAMSPGKFKQGK
jgi:hypothetical protein